MSATLTILPQPEPVTQLISDWLASLRAAAASPRTIDAYGRDVRTVLANMPLPLTPASIDMALAADTRARAASSVQRTRAALRAFGAWLSDTGRANDNPARHLKTKRLAVAPAEYLTAAEVKRLLKTIRGTISQTARRDRVIIETLLWTGIRVGELAALSFEDVDLDGKHLRVRVKGGAEQVKFIRTDLRSLLKQHMREQRWNTTPDRALFVSRQGTRLSVRQVERLVHDWLDRAGITKRLTPHGLRHTFATVLYERTRDVLVVQRALGHANVETTRRYTHLTDEGMQDAIESL